MAVGTGEGEVMAEQLNHREPEESEQRNWGIYNFDRREFYQHPPFKTRAEAEDYLRWHFPIHHMLEVREWWEANNEFFG